MLGLHGGAQENTEFLLRVWVYNVIFFRSKIRSRDQGTMGFGPGWIWGTIWSNIGGIGIKACSMFRMSDM